MPGDFQEACQHFAAAAAFQASGGPTLRELEESLPDLRVDLRRHDPRTTCAVVGGLLTIPGFHANTFRLEALAHLVVRNSRGRAMPRRRTITRWLNDQLGSGPLALVEDPVEDVFVSNVMSNRGNHRIFEGIWESNDFWAQEVLDVLYAAPDEEPFVSLRRQVESLFVISDEVAQRANLERFVMGSGDAKQPLVLPDHDILQAIAQRVTFHDSALSALRLEFSDLEPFVSKLDDFDAMTEQAVGNTKLEQRPLVRFSDCLILALPAAVSLAVRRHVLETMRTTGQLTNFSRNLHHKQLMYSIYHGLEALKTRPIKPDLPTTGASLPPFQQTICEFDNGKYAHLIILYDSLHEAVAEGVCSMAEIPPALISSLAAYLGACAQRLASQRGYSGGLTILVFGGIGRGAVAGLPEFPDSWSSLSFHLPDFLLLGGSENVSMLQLWKLTQQREALYRSGIEIGNINGDLNFYAYWRTQNFLLVPDQFPFGPGSVFVGTDFVAAFRRSLRAAYDQHSIPRDNPQTWIAVERIHPVAIFKEHRQRTYANRDEAIDRTLHGVVETATRGWWLLSGQKHSHSHHRSIQLQVWDAVMTWLEPLADVLEGHFADLPAGPIHFEIVFENLDQWQGTKIEKLPGSDPRVVVHPSKRLVILTLPMNFLILFGEPSNIAERAILENLARGVAQLCHRTVSDNEIISIVHKVLPDEDTRCFHMFRARNFRSFMFADAWPQPKPRFIQEEDVAFTKTGLAWSVFENRDQKQVRGNLECQRFLNAVVDVLWQRTVGRLKQIDRKSLIQRCLRNIDANELDHQQWKSTARAFLATHGREDEVTDAARDRDTKRNMAATASRILIEMGICECPLSGGRQISEADIDACAAELQILVETAAQSDAINSGLMGESVQIELYPSGQFDVPANFYNEVVLPYMSGNFRSGFLAAAKNAQGDYVSSGDGRESEPVALDADFVVAFKVEYGLTPEELFSVINCLEEAARVKGSVQFDTTYSELSSILRHGARLSENQIDAVLERFSLWPRSEWTSTGEGFTTKDIEPWGFGRRLAVVTRPFLKVDGDAGGSWIIHPPIIRDYVFHTLNEIYKTHYRRDYFRTTAMRSWSDAKANELGLKFNATVADEFRKLGWQARSSVKMTEFGAPANPDLGDVDVLAWKPSGVVFTTECKRLKAARNTTQIVKRLKEFRGEVGDDLHKHLNRFEWLSEHAENIAKLIGFLPMRSKLRSLLVTNTTVPMQYVTDLPIPNISIGSVTSLEQLIAANSV